MTFSHVLFCPTNGLKHKNIQFIRQRRAAVGFTGFVFLFYCIDVKMCNLLLLLISIFVFGQILMRFTDDLLLIFVIVFFLFD